MTVIIKTEEFNIHSISSNIQDIFIAEYKDKILILDGASRGDEMLIEEYIRDVLKRPFDQVKLLVVTHIHPDHSAAAHPLRKKYGIPVAAHPDVDKWYSGFRGKLQYMADIFFSHLTNSLSGKPMKRFWFKRTIKPNYYLSDNESLPFFEDWKVVHAPGHTTNDIVLHHPNESILYGGDLFLILNKKFALPFHVTLPDIYELTFKRLARLPVKTMLLAHGGKLENQKLSEIMGPLFEQMDKEIKFSFRILKPLTRISGEIKRFRKKYFLDEKKSI